MTGRIRAFAILISLVVLAVAGSAEMARAFSAEIAAASAELPLSSSVESCEGEEHHSLHVRRVSIPSRPAATPASHPTPKDSLLTQRLFRPPMARRL